MNFQFNNFQKILFTLIIFCGIFGVAGSSLADEPATYYIDDNDCSDDYAGTSSDQPLCMLAEAMTKLQAGDTLIIKDGTYYQSLNVTVSGTQTSPITIKAENDGQAIIDGQAAMQPLLIDSRSYISIEGIIFQHSNSEVVTISGTSNNISLKRLSIIDASRVVGQNRHLLLIYNTANNNLVEDCYLSQGSYSGGGRHGMILYGGAHHNTIRRNYLRYYKNQDTTQRGCSGISIYNAGSNNIIENNILDFTIADASNCDITGMKAFSIVNQWGSPYFPDDTGLFGNIAIALPKSAFSVGVNSGVNPDSTRGITGGQFINNVFLYGGNGILPASSGNILSSNNNVLYVSGTDAAIAAYTSTFPTSGTAINNSILDSSKGLVTNSGSSLLSRYNNFYDVMTQYVGDINDKLGDKNINPAYEIAAYGNGAYLMVPPALKNKGENGADIGAEVLYRYQNGVLTSERLWPWPMEERIKNETGISVTYAGNGGLWGGTWEATKDWDEIYGGSLDTTPPAAPSGLSVQ